MKTKALFLGLIMISAATFAVAGNNLSNQNQYMNTTEKASLTDINTRLVSTTAHEIVEESMAVEKWMLEISNQSWSRAEAEEEIELESWMVSLDNHDWSGNDTEPELRIEPWMYDLSSWLDRN